MTKSTTDKRLLVIGDSASTKGHVDSFQRSLSTTHHVNVLGAKPIQSAAGQQPQNQQTPTAGQPQAAPKGK